MYSTGLVAALTPLIIGKMGKMGKMGKIVIGLTRIRFEPLMDDDVDGVESTV